MTNLMRHQKGLLERRACVFMDDELVLSVKNSAATVEDISTWHTFFDAQPSNLGFGNRKIIG